MWTFTLQTGEKDVFAGGDAMTGPKFAIDAIALGKEGSISIHRYVQKGQSLVNGRDRREYHAFDKETLNLEGYDRIPRQKIDHVDGAKSKESFKHLRNTFTTRCKFDAISLVKKYEAESVPLEKLKPIILKSMVKRKGRITIKKVNNFVNGVFSKERAN